MYCDRRGPENRGSTRFFLRTPFLYSVISGLNMLTRNDPCLCVSMCVCLSVTASHFNNSWPIWMKLGPHNLNQNLRWHFSQILKFLIWWRHNGFFICFAMRHSHGRSFALILFKITDKVQLSLPMFGIENQLNRLITSGRKSASRSKKSLPWFRARLRGHGFESRRGQNFAFCFCYY